MRLIDRDALVERITDLAEANREWKPEYTEFCEDMVCMIEDTPFWSVDDLRPSGRWICGQDEQDEWCCSECNTGVLPADWFVTPIEEGYHYCPNCGAKMSE